MTTTTSRPFPARYRSECAGCPEPINPGDLAVIVQADGKWTVHRDCLPRPSAPTDSPRCGVCLHPTTVVYGDWMPPNYRQRKATIRCSTGCPGN